MITTIGLYCEFYHDSPMNVMRMPWKQFIAFTEFMNEQKEKRAKEAKRGNI